MFPTIEYIHPLMQKHVSTLIKECSKREDVNFVIVFGSATRDDCNSYSDLDVYFQGPTLNSIADIADSVPVDLDIITDDWFQSEFEGSEPSLFSQIIAKEGVAVYAKRNDRLC